MVDTKALISRVEPGRYAREFREFLLKTNMFALAMGVVIGAATTKLVNSIALAVVGILAIQLDVRPLPGDAARLRHHRDGRLLHHQDVREAGAAAADEGLPGVQGRQPSGGLPVQVLHQRASEAGSPGDPGGLIVARVLPSG